MKTLVFDIETKPAKNAQIFLPETWKIGNLKDEDKITKAIEEKKQAWKDSLPLSPLTGEICLIGYISTTDLILTEPEIIIGDEEEILEQFWELYARHDQYITCNGTEFDFPFLKVRSWINGIKPLTQCFRDGRIPNHHDIAKIWVSSFYKEHISLKNMSLALGIGNKNNEISEKFFQYFETNKEEAIEHCKNDVRLTLKIAQTIL